MRLLVYLPCWVNYKKAWEQAENLKLQEIELIKMGHSIELDIAISINAVKEVENDYAQKFSSLDRNFRLIETNIGDVNINLGFLEAARRTVDLYWIVSPDDPISNNALINIIRYFEGSSDLDFIVADEIGVDEREVILRLRDLNFDVLATASFGLVTGIVYRVEKFRDCLHHGLQASFTGWGQVAVLLGGARNQNGIKGKIIPSDQIYYRGDSKSPTTSERRENFKSYAHSFFGYPIVISMISPNPRREIQKWVWRNFHRIGSYHKAFPTEKYGYRRLTDSRYQAKLVVGDTDILTRFAYGFFTKTDFDSIRERLYFWKTR